MVITVRALLKSFIGPVAAILGSASSSGAQERPRRAAPSQSISTFIARLRSDAELRARFQAAPDAVMREHGIDPAPYQLPDRLTQAQLERFLADWSRGAGPSETPSPFEERRSPPVAVYGPPPRPR